MKLTFPCPYDTAAFRERGLMAANTYHDWRIRVVRLCGIEAWLGRRSWETRPTSLAAQAYNRTESCHAMTEDMLITGPVRSRH
jgi:hypothetical protein